MGAGAVIFDQTNPHACDTHAVKVSGASSSFRAEAAAMHLAVTRSPADKKLIIMTDSMNVISALQAWGYEEYYQDMVHQNNADII
eukprot:1458459-Rhodomonas_salina.2